MRGEAADTLHGVGSPEELGGGVREKNQSEPAARQRAGEGARTHALAARFGGGDAHVPGRVVEMGRQYTIARFGGGGEGCGARAHDRRLDLNRRERARD